MLINVFYATVQDDRMLCLEMEYLFLTCQHYFNRKIASTSWVAFDDFLILVFGFSSWISKPVSQPVSQ